MASQWEKDMSTSPWYNERERLCSHHFSFMVDNAWNNGCYAMTMVTKQMIRLHYIINYKSCMYNEWLFSVYTCI